MINQIGLLVGKQLESMKLVNDIELNIKKIKDENSRLTVKPKFILKSGLIH